MVRDKKYAFINQSYRPTRNDLICMFKVTPNEMSVKEAVNDVALESSVGTWTPVSSNKKYVNKLGAKVFAISAIGLKLHILKNCLKKIMFRIFYRR